MTGTERDVLERPNPPVPRWRPLHLVGTVQVGPDGSVTWSDAAYLVHGRARWRRVRTISDATTDIADDVRPLAATYECLVRGEESPLVRYRVRDDSGLLRDIELTSTGSGRATVVHVVVEQEEAQSAEPDSAELDSAEPITISQTERGAAPLLDEAAEVESTEVLAETFSKQNEETPISSLATWGRHDPAFQASPVAMAWLGADGSFVEINDSFATLLGRSRSAVLRADASSFADIGVDPVERRLERSDGTTLWVTATCVSVDTRSDVVALLTLTDVTAARDAEAQLRAQAMHDELTGLPNRRMLLQQLSQAMARVDRNSNRLTVFFIDVDALKRVNDTFGHQTGDRMIVETARRLRSTLRDSDVLARIGGDEFVAFCEDEVGAGEVDDIGRRMLAAVREPMQLGMETQHVRLSIGAATSMPHERDPAALLARADAAMYRAKATGGARVVVDQPGYRGLRGPLPTSTEWQAAIEAEELVLHYQPVITAADSMLLGFEGRLRWDHPSAGLLTVGDLLQTPGANSIGDAVVRWGVHRALTDITALGRPGLSVWLTVPERAVLQPAVAAGVASAYASLGSSNVPNLVLDRRESDVGAALRRHAASIPLADLLASGPVRTGLDDVRGDDVPIASWSSLRAVSLRLAPDLTAAAVSDARAAALVRALVRAAEALETIVIAAHVDSDAQLAMAIRAGVHAVQGSVAGPLTPFDDLSRIWSR